MMSAEEIISVLNGGGQSLHRVVLWSGFAMNISVKIVKSFTTLTFIVLSKWFKVKEVTNTWSA